MRAHRSGKDRISAALFRLAPLGAFSGLGAGFLAADFAGATVMAVFCGAGAAVAGKRLLNREGSARRELYKRARNNVQELRAVAWHDRVAAPQMERMISLQNGLLESWELVPADHRVLLDEDIFAILEEVEDAAWLARRRAALRNHLRSLSRYDEAPPLQRAARKARSLWETPRDVPDRREISRRIESLEREIENLPEGSMLRTTFENTLVGRREELEGFEDMQNGISLINAQLEGAESLLGSLRGDLLTLDSSLSPLAFDSELARLKERVRAFKRSLDEVAYTVEAMPRATISEPMTEPTTDHPRTR